MAPSPATPSYAVSVGDAAGPKGDLARLLGAPGPGAPAAQPAAASRFNFLGVLSPQEGYAGSYGVALIGIDGKPARAYKVGSRLLDNWVLQGVTRRTASLGPENSGAAVVLELPEKPGPATGSLPGFNGGEMVSPSSVSVPPPQIQQPVTAEQPQPAVEQPQAVPAYEPPPQLATPMNDDSRPGPRMGQGPPRSRSESR